MGTIIVKDRQTLLDVALQTSGSLEGLMDLAIANGRSVTDELADGEELITGEVVDRKVVERYEMEGVCPATEEIITTKKISDENNSGDQG
ncbi:MAG: hypothetical protein IJY31_03345 [Muribaculaceae bacterium]|nr:hypothetical protein [Muribaculaceae bacterium]